MEKSLVRDLWAEFHGPQIHNIPKKEMKAWKIN